MTVEVEVEVENVIQGGGEERDERIGIIDYDKKRLDLYNFKRWGLF